MQGKGDPRKSKDDIRPEHNTAKYLDDLVEDAIEWWGRYADVLSYIGYGNHETSIIKFQETDVLERFVKGYNRAHSDANLALGGYGSWLTIMVRRATKSPRIIPFRIHHYHGSGGGGPVTKNMIQHQRQAAMIEGADLVWLGHTHDYFYTHFPKHLISNQGTPGIKTVHFLQTPTYKEEFQDRHHGWHVERGGGPKPLGGSWLTIRPRRVKIDELDYWRLEATFIPTDTAW